MDRKLPEIAKSQLYYGAVYHWITIASCLISLIAPVFILILPNSNLLNPNLIFNAIFEGNNPAEIWELAGVSFQSDSFWKLFRNNLFTPDGFATFGVAIGCSVTLWALIPAFWQFIKEKEYFYACVSLFVMSLVILAMSGLVNMD